MDTRNLIEAAAMYGVSLDSQWNFLFTMSLAAVGVLATVRQFLPIEKRLQPRFMRAMRIVQLCFGLFLLNGFVVLSGIYERLNILLAAIWDAAHKGGDAALQAAFEPYLIWPELMRGECSAGDEWMCALNLPPSLYGYAAAALFLTLMVPRIGGAWDHETQ